MGRLSTRLVGFLVVCVFLSGAHVDAQRQLELVGHDETKPLLDLAFSPDGKLLGSCGGDGTARVWLADTGELVATLDHKGPAQKVAFSPDGAFLATCFTSEPIDGRRIAGVKIWNVQSWEGTQITNLTSGRAKGVSSLAFSPDGQRLVTATSCFGRKGITDVKLWDVQTRKELATIGDSDTILDVSFSPDGKFLAAVGSYGSRLDKGAVLLWKTDSMNKVARLRNDGRNFNLEFSPNGRFLAVGTSLLTHDNFSRPPCVVNLWNLDRSKLVGNLSGFVGSINSISFSTDSRSLAATATVDGGWAKESGEVVQVWRLDTGARRILERNTHSRSLEFSPAGGVLATSFTTPRPGVRLWDTRSGSVLATLEQGEPPDVLTKIEYSPQGDKLAVANINRTDTSLLCIWFVADSADKRESEQ